MVIRRLHFLTDCGPKTDIDVPGQKWEITGDINESLVCNNSEVL